MALCTKPLPHSSWRSWRLRTLSSASTSQLLSELHKLTNLERIPPFWLRTPFTYVHLLPEAIVGGYCVRHQQLYNHSSVHLRQQWRCGTRFIQTTWPQLTQGCCWASLPEALRAPWLYVEVYSICPLLLLLTPSLFPQVCRLRRDGGKLPLQNQSTFCIWGNRRGGRLFLWNARPGVRLRVPLSKYQVTQEQNVRGIALSFLLVCVYYSHITYSVSLFQTSLHIIPRQYSLLQTAFAKDCSIPWDLNRIPGVCEKTWVGKK